jgi:hypothetical protein
MGAAAIAYDFRVQFILPPEAALPTAAGVTYSERDVLYYAEHFQEKDTRFDILRSGTKDSMPPVEEDASSNDDMDLAPQDSGEYTTPALSS